jgi:hypothetical protein
MSFKGAAQGFGKLPKNVIFPLDFAVHRTALEAFSEMRFLSSTPRITY